MNRTIITLAILALTATASAEPPSLEGPERSAQRVEEKVDRLTEHLGLDATQADAVAAHLETAHAEQRELKNSVREVVEALKAADEAGDEKAMKKGLKELDALEEDLRAVKLNTRDAVRAELTTEQQVAFALAEIRRHRAHRGGERPRSGR